MPLTRRSLTLEASPQAARVARRWVSDVLSAVGRDDLLFAAELGTTELVTNALIHATPPLVVRVRGTRRHPRVEVSDGSGVDVRPGGMDLPEDDLLTFGRGLDLVAMNSTRWGSEITPDGDGKTVWFEPTATPDHSPGERTHLTEPAPPPADPTPQPGSVRVTLVDLDTRLFGHLRAHHFELRRELRLLAMADPERYPVAVRMTEVFARADQERRQSVGVARLDSAIAGGETRVTLTYDVPASTPATMADLLDLFHEVTRVFGDEELLAVTPPADLQRMQGWYFGEFVRQAGGEPPRPWTPEND